VIRTRQSSILPKDFDKEWWKDKECYRCDKKGHPASACSVKPPSDDDDKSSRSSKSSSKVIAEIQKSMKTMGKAMTQLGEGADFDDDLFEEQSHAQVSAYLYATRKTMSMRNQLLLDNQSLVHIICNPKFVTNIRSSESSMVLKSSGGTLPINKVADFEGFEIETTYSHFRWSKVSMISLMMGMSSSSIGRQRASLIWCLSPTPAGCMCMTWKMPEDWRATLHVPHKMPKLI